MATWKSRGLRGSTLEDLVNRTNEQYREKGLALIQKIPTPITPVRMDKENRHITLAYFEQRSTVEYKKKSHPSLLFKCLHKFHLSVWIRKTVILRWHISSNEAL